MSEFCGTSAQIIKDFGTFNFVFMYHKKVAYFMKQLCITTDTIP